MITIAPETERANRVSVRSLASQPEQDEAHYIIEGSVDGFQFALPVEHKRNGSNGGSAKSMFKVEVGGAKVSHDEITFLPDAVIDALDQLLYAERLPRYAFQIPGQPALLPVYPSGKGWLLHEPDGPILKADDLSALRRHLAGYLDSHTDHLAMFELSSELQWVSPMTEVVFR